MTPPPAVTTTAATRTAAPILVLGGTSEATELAATLTAAGWVVVLSLAGKTGQPHMPLIRVRLGGFGGVPGLAEELRQGGYGGLINATHPFSTQMAHHAAAAAEIAGIAHLRLLRPPWQPVPGDTWHDVDDLAGAARRLTGLRARRAFLSIGREHLEPFANLPGLHLVLRSVQPPSRPPSENVTVLLGRGPFTVDGELSLLREHCVEVLVTRNSGGRAVAPKLAAARFLGIPVIMVRRPDMPLAGHVATSVTEAITWVEDRQQRTIEP